MNRILTKSLSALILLLALILVVGLLVLLSFGVGWLLSRFLPLSVFEAGLMSVIALIGIFVSAATLLRSVVDFMRSKPMDEDEYADWMPDEEMVWDEELDREIDDILSGARHKSGTENGSAPGPDDPCPCGSGKRYKDCHGRWMSNN